MCTTSWLLVHHGSQVSIHCQKIWLCTTWALVCTMVQKGPPINWTNTDTGRMTLWPTVSVLIVLMTLCLFSRTHTFLCVRSEPNFFFSSARRGVLKNMTFPCAPWCTERKVVHKARSGAQSRPIPTKWCTRWPVQDHTHTHTHTHTHKPLRFYYLNRWCGR